MFTISHSFLCKILLIIYFPRAQVHIWIILFNIWNTKFSNYLVFKAQNSFPFLIKIVLVWTWRQVRLRKRCPMQFLWDIHIFTGCNTTSWKSMYMINRLWYGNFHIPFHINPRPISALGPKRPLADSILIFKLNWFLNKRKMHKTIVRV